MRALRVVILIAAVACLGLAMCAHSQPAERVRAPAPAPSQVIVAPQAMPLEPPPDAAPARRSRDLDHFSATKAPGFMY